MNSELLTPEIAQQIGPGTFELAYTEGLIAQLESLDRVPPVIGKNIFLTAFLSEQELTHEFGVVGNKELTGRKDLLQSASETTFINHNLDAGLGSSVKRKTELQQIAPYINRGTDPEIGSKSTDLYKPIPAPDGGVMYVNVAEIKLNRVKKAAAQFGHVELRPIVNHESEGPMESLYEMETVDSRLGHSARMTYRQELETDPKITIGNMLLQAALPTIDQSSGELTMDKTAPGGHGQAASMVVHEIGNTSQDGSKRVRAIYNGDGPGNFYSAEMVGYAANEAAIVMIVTPTGPGDVKGGKTALKLLPNGRKVPYMLEVAQAKEAGKDQEELFQKAGQKDSEFEGEYADIHNPEGQFFNTNNVLLSEHHLAPFLQRIKEEFGEEFYNEALTPDFFPKPDGEGSIQLEGAMCSLMLKLNELVATDQRVEQTWQEVGGGKAFLKFINVESEDRDKYFAPIKFPIDFILQFYTDHFDLDMEEWMLVNNRPGHLPHFGGDFIDKESWFADVWNCKQAFGERSQIMELDSMDVHGQILFADAIHGGHEYMESKYNGVIDLNNPAYKMHINGVDNMDKPLMLAHKRIVVDEEGNIDVTIQEKA